MPASLFWLLKAAGSQPWNRLVPVLAEHLDGIAGFAQRLPADLVDEIVATGRLIAVRRVASQVAAGGRS
jgi:hypothetical protein